MRKLVFILLFFCLTTPCLAVTQLKKTVMPSGGDYTSLEACMNANEQNLVTADQYFDVEIDGTWSSADTTAVVIHNYTTDATRYINIYTTTAAARHKGIYSTSYYTLVVSGTCLNVSSSNVTIDGLQVGFARTGNDQAGIKKASSGNTIIKNNIVVAVTGGSNIMGIWLEPQDGVGSVYNNIVYGAWGYACIFKSDANAGTYYIYNNTFRGATRGIWNNRANDTTSFTLKNNICNDNTTDYQAASGTFNSASTYNITNDTPAAVHCFGVTADSGTTDSAAAGKLIQSGQNFSTTCKVGMVIKNTTDTTYTYITAIDSDTQLSVNNDIFANGEAYTIYTNMFGVVTFVNETAGSEDLHLGSTDTVAKDKGANLYADANIAITTDIDGDARPDSATTFDIGADEFVSAVTYFMQPIINIF